MKEIECPVCKGQGTLFRRNQDGSEEAVRCPYCKGRGKVDPESIRLGLTRSSPPSLPRGFGLRYPGTQHGSGRSSYGTLLPLSMDPRASSDGVPPLDKSADSLAGQKEMPSQEDIAADEAAARDRKGKRHRKEKEDEVETRLFGIVEQETYEQVTCDFSLPDAQVDVPDVHADLVLRPEEEIGEFEMLEQEAYEQVKCDFSLPDAQAELEKPGETEIRPSGSLDAPVTLDDASLAGRPDLGTLLDPLPPNVDYDPLYPLLGPDDFPTPEDDDTGDA